ncbi:decaprenyl-phosphate phosphoribosyltransferase [Candidatus Daviesbacteria bacterium]|nr:decaprenyl-phosphate phosphoribosyltransferase [Candidatus Daviesbacteria bacterium]
MNKFDGSSLVWGLIKVVRPRQWIKNFALFAGLIFSGNLNNSSAITLTLQAFIIFCGITSVSYILNDVFDVERDRLHPFKRKRPIASGVVPTRLAITLATLLIIILLPLAYLLSPSFFLAVVAYLLLQLFYSAFLKTVILLDVMVIAAGFVLRIYAGVWTIDAHLNVWFLLAVTSFALFLAIGKRRSELTLLAHQAAKHRETLLHYPENLLDILTGMFATATWLSFAFFAFLQPPISARPRILLWFSNLSLPFTEAKFLMITVPVVIYGVMRYLYIIYEKKEGESPERVILTDTPLLVTTLLWLGLVIIIIYFLGA